MALLQKVLLKLAFNVASALRFASGYSLLLFGRECSQATCLCHSSLLLCNVQDVLMLHAQERNLAERPKAWQAYRLTTPSDTGVECFWSWLHEAGGDVPWAGGRSSFKDLPPRRSRAELLDHYERHTQFCPECKKVGVAVR